MKVTIMKLTDLIKPEKNVRIHTGKQLKEFERSIKMFGQIRPIVIDEKKVILAGNGLYDALVAMGEETAEVYQYSNLTENQKKKLMIADNKIFNLGIENLETLNSFLEELQGDLDIPGFDEEILKQMVCEAEEVTDKISEYGTLNDEEIQNIKKNGERKEQKINDIQSNINDFDSNHAETEKNNITESHVIENNATEIQKFMVCPKCGEKIWL